jgi:vacuolar-type H+-ATPase subunit I/STV1
VLKSQSGNNGENLPTQNACFLLEIKNLIEEQHKEVIVLIEKIATSLQQTNTPTHTQDDTSPPHSQSPSHSHPQEKTFHLHSFLNEKCKHSINMKEFIDSLKVNLTDLENTGKYGFIKSMSQFITRELGKLDV